MRRRKSEIVEGPEYASVELKKLPVRNPVAQPNIAYGETVIRHIVPENQQRAFQADAPPVSDYSYCYVDDLPQGRSVPPTDAAGYLQLIHESGNTSEVQMQHNAAYQHVNELGRNQR